ASGLAATNPERARQRLLPQTHKLASHNPRGKGATDGSSMVAMMMKLARSGRSKARHGLIARYGGGQHGFAIGVYRFAYGQGWRYHTGAGMGDRLGMRVVKVQAVRETAVGQHGTGHGQTVTIVQHSALRLTTPGAHRLHNGPGVFHLR